ncbi:MAG: sugar phosphate isomerase/epimerase family protein [Lentisphaeria bacterium]|jgi:hexosaminidase|nr:sugar phosphate isomerase/epimerase family protein [Lentisphaeria bacterium]
MATASTDMSSPTRSSTPRLGVSLHCIGKPVDGGLLKALQDSQVATLELYPLLFTEENLAARTALRVAMMTKGIRAATVHARFGGKIDVSSLDDGIRAQGLAAWREAMDMAVEFDAGMVVVHPSAEPIPDAEREARIARSVRMLESLADDARELGLRFAVELLPRTCLGRSAAELLRLLDGLDPAVFGACLDVNHLMDRPQTVPDAVRELGSRLFTLHLSDYDGIDEKHWPPGQGVIGWPAFMQALRDIGYTGPFNYEANFPGDTPAQRFAALQDNFRWLGAL